MTPSVPSFGQIPVVRGSGPLYAIKFTNNDGSDRDVSAYTARFQAYKDDGTLLFPEKTLSPGTSSQFKVISFATSDLTQRAGTYKAKLFLDVPANPEIWNGALYIDP